jgi:hypothetical protein
MTGVPIPPARPPRHDDGLLDAIALIEASARDDFEAVVVLGRCADDVSVIAALAQIIGSAFSADDIASGQFRAWAVAMAQEGGS